MFLKIVFCNGILSVPHACFYVLVLCSYGSSCLIQINEWKKWTNCKLEMWNKRNDDDDFVQASVNIMSVFNKLMN